MNSLTQFAALQMCNILQNVSQNRSDKKITITDIKHAIAAAHLCIYKGTSMYSESQKDWIHPIGHYPHPFICCIKGNSDGTASCLWGIVMYSSFAISPETIVGGVTSGHGSSIINFRQNVKPSEIHPTLTINPGEIKILVESFLYTDDRAKRSPKQVFGFFIINPQTNEASHGYFNSVVIFSPRVGLFDETAPK